MTPETETPILISSLSAYPLPPFDIVNDVNCDTLVVTDDTSAPEPEPVVVTVTITPLYPVPPFDIVNDVNCDSYVVTHHT